MISDGWILKFNEVYGIRGYLRHRRAAVPGHGLVLVWKASFVSHDFAVPNALGAWKIRLNDE